MYQVETRRTECAIDAFCSQYVDVPRFLEACKQCPNYGNRWSCPPYYFDSAAYWKKYKSLHLYCVKLIYDPELVERTFTKEERGGILRASLDHEKDQLRRRLELATAGVPGAVALASGCCELCTRCARVDGRPCRYPGHCHFSIESLGGDVEKITKELFGTDVVWMQKNKLPPYFTLVGGILLP